ncbi:MAG: phosphatase PAP2 family protein [Acidobacteriia bacterium]|nr:phosphatase PAP2 family protein [Terriglobia bacterium]
MRFSEGLAAGYFGVMAVAAWIRPLPMARRVQVTIIGIVMIAAIWMLPRDASPLVRDWAPAILILVGYYVSGRFFVGSAPAFERWLMAWDHRLLGDPTTRFAHWPRPVLAYLEVIYLGCFLLIPAGFAALVWTGRRAMADHYWTMVVAAEFGAFAPLSLIQTRPPWALERPSSQRARAFHQIASGLVSTFTIRANTFPSGHVAGSLAVAMAVGVAMPWAGAILFVLAASISLACVVGRYHYIVDVVAGAALALVIWGLVAAAGV